MTLSRPLPELLLLRPANFPVKKEEDDRTEDEEVLLQFQSAISWCSGALHTETARDSLGNVITQGDDVQHLDQVDHGTRHLDRKKGKSLKNVCGLDSDFKLQRSRLSA
ncbi:hypothetical protein EYF80_045931 [Liparis tanakae]|uniref:Uncharacterized protein n=1 Tax=Liparis tanakae TaxID=230148 RepID=A0A4Z2FRK1_9TELE|nr:hypothetical protein EYF80_045931 [Liparis tanakae]